MNNMIVEAAIIFEGITYRGKRHLDCVRQIERETGAFYRTNDGREGFLDQSGVFHDRYEAAKIAYQCGQIKNPTDRLISSQIQ